MIWNVKDEQIRSIWTLVGSCSLNRRTRRGGRVILATVGRWRWRSSSRACSVLTGHVRKNWTRRNWRGRSIVHFSHRSICPALLRKQRTTRTSSLALAVRRIGWITSTVLDVQHGRRQHFVKGIRSAPGTCRSCKSSISIQLW